MAVSRAVAAIRNMRDCVADGTEDDIHLAASWALIFLAEQVATDAGWRYHKAEAATQAAIDTVE